jgi:hypothetical protein
VERSFSNNVQQFCKIKQQIGSGGTNTAFVEQTIWQSQATGPQDAQQIARVRQFNAGGANSSNESTVFQTVFQNEFKSAEGLLLMPIDQTQEAHQNVDVCQGGAANACSPITGTDVNNKSSIVQTNLQKARVDLGSNTLALMITQQQNANGLDPKSLAVLSQNTSNKTNESLLVHKNAQFASVYRAVQDDNDNDEDVGDDNDEDDAAPPIVFSGTVTQLQGNGSNCDSKLGGLCGFVEQTQFSAPPLARQIAYQWQDELQKAVAPTGLTPAHLTQIQHGDEFCCATQLPPAPLGNPNNVDFIHQKKVQLTTGSAATADMWVHCATSGDCMIDQTYSHNGVTQTNSCPGTFPQCSDQTFPCSAGKICNPTINCISPAEGSGCTKGVGAPPTGVPPPFQCPDVEPCTDRPVIR